MISLLIDLLSLPSLLLIGEGSFEFKYQSSLDWLNDLQTTIVLKTFAKIFYQNFGEEYAGKGMTLMELMVHHRLIFDLVDNMHDLI